MTEENATGEHSEPETNRQTMRNVDHTHPETNATFGAAFRRGPVVAADGGDPETDETMEDVDHEPPGEGVTRAYERGTEGRDETV
ncbi:hypothetical protein ACOZ4I_06680 [Haloarcula salina]|uniref:hypothetical protein n=1 Tax=Haloarcula salina TaxID=1429914 RepID=UPI003C6F7526